MPDSSLQLVNGQKDMPISIHDRGLMFGDGVFETLAFVDEQYRGLDWHLRRLQSSCQHLKINLDIVKVKADLCRFADILLAEKMTQAVVKLIITRGSSQTAYRYDDSLEANRYLSARAWPNLDVLETGANVRRCQHVLAMQPELAGLKHLSRLDYVLARNEWQDEYHEGLLFDANDCLVEACSANVFLVKNNEVFTPDLSMAGVDGVVRQQLLALCQQNAITISQQCLNEADLLAADEAFISNAVMGLCPIKHYAGTTGSRCFDAKGVMTQYLQTLWAESFLVN